MLFRSAKSLALDMKMKDLRDGVQTIRYQLSTLQTTNGQAPFSTIYLEIEEGHPYEKEMALICEEMIDRKSVVEGKSVFACVVPVGRPTSNTQRVRITRSSAT